MSDLYRWIPWEERTPEPGQNVVMQYEDGTIDAGHIICVTHNSEWLDGAEENKIVAWMPLPEPYKEDNNG